MMKIIKKRSRLVYASVTTIVLITLVFSSVTTALLGAREPSLLDTNDGEEQTLNGHTPGPYDPFRDKDWNYWSNPPHMYSILSGNVGIGTTNPLYNLTISRSSPFAEIALVSQNSWPLVFSQKADSVFDIKNGGQVRMTIKPDGNVGIGSWNPEERLTVNGVLSLAETSVPAVSPGYGKLYANATHHTLFYQSGEGQQYDVITPEYNPMQVALNRWWECNKVGHLFGNTIHGMFRSPTCFDGTHIWGFTYDAPNIGFTKLRVTDGQMTEIPNSPISQLHGPMAFDGKYIWYYSDDMPYTRLYRLYASDGLEFDHFDWDENDIIWMAFDGEYMWATDGLEIFKLSTGQQITIAGQQPLDMPGPATMLLADGEYIWAAGDGVVRINRDDLSQDPVLEVHDDNNYIGFDGRYLWISAYHGDDTESSYVYVINRYTFDIIQEFTYDEPDDPEHDNPAIALPKAMIFDGKDMWIVNKYRQQNREYLTKIDTRTYEVKSNDCPSHHSIIQLIFDGANVWGVDPNTPGNYGGLWKY